MPAPAPLVFGSASAHGSAACILGHQRQCQHRQFYSLEPTALNVVYDVSISQSCNEKFNKSCCLQCAEGLKGIEKCVSACIDWITHGKECSLLKSLRSIWTMGAVSTTTTTEWVVSRLTEFQAIETKPQHELAIGEGSHLYNRVHLYGQIASNDLFEQLVCKHI